MIVLGADMHKRTHTIAAVAAATGEVLGDRAIGVGDDGFDAVLERAQALARPRLVGDLAHHGGKRRPEAVEAHRRGQRMLDVFSGCGSGARGYGAPRSEHARGV